MTIDVFIPAIGGESMLESTIGCLLRTKQLGASTSIIVIDNGSRDPIWMGRDFIPAYLIRNKENIGMIESLQQAKDHSQSDILMFMHSDFLIYEPGWDAKIAKAFKDDPKLGLLGAVGGAIAATNGGRSNVLCSFRDGHVHGVKTPPGVHPTVLLDGCCLIFRRSAMKDIPDREFPVHHFHDKDYSLQMILNGYRVGVIQMDCEHLSGQTSCQPECQETFKKWGGDQAIYDKSEQRYLQKWGPMLPISVDANWNYSTRAGPVFVE